jgi:anti-sigma factor RsiW
VRPWFAGRIDFARATPDLRAQGFPLIGGRLDYVGQRMVAALVYRRRQHVINVFVTPQTGTSLALDGPASLRHGYNMVGWQDAGLAYVAISDLNTEELGAFRRLFEKTLPQRP